MRNTAAAILISALGLCPAPCRAQDVIWDYGPQTGPVGGCWQNITDTQNFAELVVLDHDAVLGGYQLFSCQDGLDGSTFEFKVLADDGGTPGTDIARVKLTNQGHSVEMGQFRYDFAFGDIPLDAGVYWVGLAGVGFDAGQTSIKPGPGDSQMAQFSAREFVQFAGVGDQMFRLLGPQGDICYPDLTGDGVLDLFDFLAFVNQFNAEAKTADCDQSGSLDLFDFLCFTNAFNTGC